MLGLVVISDQIVRLEVKKLLHFAPSLFDHLNQNCALKTIVLQELISLT